jgi:hypothetical protein
VLCLTNQRVPKQLQNVSLGGLWITYSNNAIQSPVSKAVVSGVRLKQDLET